MIRRVAVTTSSVLLLIALAATPSRAPVAERTATLGPGAIAPAGCTISGTAGDDVLRGGPAADTICGLGGDDVLLGRGGDDELVGGAGSDALLAGAGADRARGGPGIDLLVGGRGSDVLRGGAGDDRCSAGRADRAVSCAMEPEDPVVAAAGDIACAGEGEPGGDRCQQVSVSDLLVQGDAWAVLTLGDNQYDDGELAAFRRFYADSWGRVKAITRPSPGNHDYHVSGARGYVRYFGPLAGPRGRGYHSFDVGSWHVVALDSNCGEVGGCDAGSPQERWLREDLAAHPAGCTLAYWHHPRFSSGDHGDNGGYDAFWRALGEAGADVVLNGHDHDYERFAPQDPDQRADPDGIRAFVVGTGGASLRGFESVQPNSEVRASDAFGVLELTLHADGYDWRFVPAAGGTFEDSGHGSCH
ncbi:MAG TPA: metallophosphoesterase [Actinomycetota bacterium]